MPVQKCPICSTMFAVMSDEVGQRVTCPRCEVERVNNRGPVPVSEPAPVPAPVVAIVPRPISEPLPGTPPLPLEIPDAPPPAVPARDPIRIADDVLAHALQKDADHPAPPRRRREPE